jgi:hypothetical protein
MFVKEISAVKELLAEMTENGQIADWELPYENLLTRLTAAIFFVTPQENTDIANLSVYFENYPHFSIRENIEKKLSALKYRITFSAEEKEKNSQLADNSVS